MHEHEHLKNKKQKKKQRWFVWESVWKKTLKEKVQKLHEWNDDFRQTELHFWQDAANKNKKYNKWEALK